MRKNLAVRASAIALAAAIAAPQLVHAQDDVIIVTGSFIKKKNQADLPSPLDTVSADNITDIGANNIADITQTLTINSGAENNPDAFTQSGTTGTSNINLRGLGLGSTLVLLNGGRQVTTATATNNGIQFVDTSSLVPLIAIDRVEILKDGASALYGSDAVAGVVNFITRDNYDGIAFSGQYTSHQSRGDYNEFNLQGMIGKDFDRGNILVAAQYSQATPLTTRERRLSVPANDTSALGNPGAFFTTAPFGPLPAGTPLIDPGCAAAGGFPTPVTPLDPTASTVGLCGFDFGEFFNLVTDSEKFLGYAAASLDVSDSIEFKIEGSYADNTDIRGNSPTFPFLQLGSAVVPGSTLGPLGIMPNPFNFFPGQPTLVFFGRASGNGGEVSPNLTSSETWRGNASLGGDNFLNNGSWEISFTRARNNYVINTEDTVTDRFQCSLTGFQSLPAIPGLTGGTDCSSANPNLTAFGDSVPAVGSFFNPFSTSFNVAPNSGALLDYSVQFQTRDLQSDLTVGEGYFSTDLFAIGDGAVGMAAGVQYRKTKLVADFDEISQRDGFAFLIGEQPYAGTQDVIAGFLEIAIPLTPWLDIQGAVRHERYGDDGGGSTTDPKIAVLVRPTDAVSLRGSYSTSFRAPSVFQQQGQGTSLQQVSDPANGGANAFVAVRSSGNPNLLPEESQAFNFGGTWQPFGGMSLSVDYYNFQFENVITPQNAQALLNADPMGPGIIRSPAGTVVQINSGYVNASQVETSGLDWSASWAIDTENTGTFTPTVTGTYVLKYDLIDPLAGPVDGAGFRNFSNFGTSTPELRLNAGLNWSNGAHSANVFVRHIGSYLDDQNALAAIENDTRVDIQYRLGINEYMNRDEVIAATIGVRNLFGATAPYVATNGGFDSKVHDPRGTLLYFGLDLEF